MKIKTSTLLCITLFFSSQASANDFSFKEHAAVLTKVCFSAFEKQLRSTPNLTSLGYVKKGKHKFEVKGSQIGGKALFMSRPKVTFQYKENRRTKNAYECKITFEGMDTISLNKEPTKNELTVVAAAQDAATSSGFKSIGAKPKYGFIASRFAKSNVKVGVLAKSVSQHGNRYLSLIFVSRR